MKYLIFLIPLILQSQVSSVREDVFPLGLYHTWSYKIQSGSQGCQSFATDCSGFNDSGTVVYSITDSSKKDDTIYWGIKVVRFLYYHEYDQAKNYDTSYFIYDSSSFKLDELLTFRHQLVAESVDESVNPVWQFAQTDSIDKFQETDSTGASILSSIKSGVPSLYRTIVFHADTGLVSYNSSGSSILFSKYKNTSLSQSVLNSVKNTLVELPNSPILENIYPNPFNSSSIISFSIPQSGSIIISVYNILGEKVSIVTRSYYSAGAHTVSWIAGNLSSGIYFIKLEYGNISKIRKCLLLK